MTLNLSAEDGQVVLSYKPRRRFPRPHGCGLTAEELVSDEINVLVRERIPIMKWFSVCLWFTLAVGHVVTPSFYRDRALRLLKESPLVDTHVDLPQIIRSLGMSFHPDYVRGVLTDF